MQATMLLIGHPLEIQNNVELASLYADFLTAYKAEQAARIEEMIIPNAAAPAEAWRPIEAMIVERWPMLKVVAVQAARDIETSRVKDVHGQAVEAHVTKLVIDGKMLTAYGQPFNLRSYSYAIDQLPTVFLAHHMGDQILG
jgi:hypothetical protein